MATSIDDTTKVSKCCLKACKTGEISSKTGRVEVKAVSTKPNAAFLGDWSEEGDAVFHGECWQKMLSARRNKELNAEEQKLVTEANKTAEYFDSEEKLKSEAERFVKLLRTSKHCIAFTGAGISTSAGIGDFRGKSGKWTEQDKAKQHGKQKTKKPKRVFIYNQLRPTYTHEAINKLVEAGYIKFVISQNVDGLHRLSGVPRDRIAELHGNVFHEKCEICKKIYERPYSYRDERGKIADVPAKKCKGCRLNHRTGRKCEQKNCAGYLMNTVINFGDNLDDKILDDAEMNAKKNDLCLSLGSTLQVSPACDFVEMGRPIRLVICNRQPTPFDDFCYKEDRTLGQLGCRVFGDCDDFMKEVMRCILLEESKEWEDARGDRMKNYNKQREQ